MTDPSSWQSCPISCPECQGDCDWSRGYHLKQQHHCVNCGYHWKRVPSDKQGSDRPEEIHEHEWKPTGTKFYCDCGAWLDPTTERVHGPDPDSQAEPSDSPEAIRKRLHDQIEWGKARWPCDGDCSQPDCPDDENIRHLQLVNDLNAALGYWTHFDSLYHQAIFERDEALARVKEFEVENDQLRGTIHRMDDEQGISDLNRRVDGYIERVANLTTERDEALARVKEIGVWHDRHMETIHNDCCDWPDGVQTCPFCETIEECPHDFEMKGGAAECTICHRRGPAGGA